MTVTSRDIPWEDLVSLPLSFWSSFAVAALAAPITYRLLIQVRARQTVSQHLPEHQKKQGTPTMGGLVALAGLLGAFGVWEAVFAVGPDFPRLHYVNGNALAWLVLLLGFGVIGFVDDYVVPRMKGTKRGLGWVPKLVMQFAVAIVVAMMTGFNTPWDVFCVSFLLVTFSNAYNFSDGLDGLAGGLAVILGLTLCGLGLLMHAPHCQIFLSVSLVGAMLPFLFLNAPPAKVFMGDVGSLPIGAGIGWLIVMLAGQSGSLQLSPEWMWITLALSTVLILELVFVPIQIFSVKVLKKRLPIRTPIHHTFEAMGWPETRIVATFHLVQAVASLVAISLAIYLGNPQP